MKGMTRRILALLLAALLLVSATSALADLAEISFVQPEADVAEVEEFSLGGPEAPAPAQIEAPAVEGDVPKQSLIPFLPDGGIYGFEVGEAEVLAVMLPMSFTLYTALGPNDGSIKWTSNNNKVATVDAYGNVTTLKNGTVTITAEDAYGTKASQKVEVQAQKVTGISLAQGKQVTMNVGEMLQLNASVTGAHYYLLSWSSKKPAVANVDVNGIVTAYAKGKTKITAIANGKKATITVNVVNPYEPTSVSIAEGASLTAYAGQSFQLNAVLAPEIAVSGLTWKSSKSKVATVYENGVVNALSKGKAKITVTTDNKKKATITLNVVDPYEATSLSITPGSLTLSVGDSVQLSAVVQPDSAAGAPKTWSSSKQSVAGVDANGVVTAYAAGKAKITLKAGGKKATATVVVQGNKPEEDFSKWEISQYMYQNVEATAKLLGLKYHGVDRYTTEPSVSASGSNVVLEGPGYITSISITGNSKCNVNAAYFGTNRYTALSLLKNSGWIVEWEDDKYADLKKKIHVSTPEFGGDADLWINLSLTFDGDKINGISLR